MKTEAVKHNGYDWKLQNSTTLALSPGSVTY